MKPEKFIKLLRIKNINSDADFKIVDILGISIILLGFYFFINSLIFILTELLMMALLYFDSSNGFNHDIIGISIMIGSLFKAIIGLFFILKGIKLAKLIVKK